ncbi:MAG: AAA family ATPase [Leptolyngbyaceae cyanobacterium]
MFLKTVLVRFYKSFNDDFYRRLNSNAKPFPWEIIGDNWYPYIKVPIDRKITTVVGANESGKSHLLSAIRKSVTGKGIERDDFCRYSKFFTVKKGQLKHPDFGTEWIDLNTEESDFFRKAFEIPPHQVIDSIILFRNNIDLLKLYLKNDSGNYTEYKVSEGYTDQVPEILPRVFTIDSDIALPDSVPIRKLIDPDLDNPKSGLIEFLDYKQKGELSGLLDQLTKMSKPQRNVVPNNKSEEYDELVGKIVSSLKKSVSESDALEKKQKETELAKKLIYNIAEIDSEVLVRLSEALKQGKQGYANGLVKMINEQLAKRLNFPNWWVQDKNFQLKLMARDHELVFTITDRTGTEYSFTERSSGLKYFLSYYIQYRSHVPLTNKNEILLMDEPDTYLSSRAQQDLLRIFEAFADPAKDSHLTKPIQVVYVTHSPFLIDKNHSERIRVLRKGNDDEGTLVVRTVARNHYEPLRSAFGAFVGETTFIGNCNLMVEGASDQILLAGAASFLARNNASQIECLDLNNTTIVPAGSASHIPYQQFSV